jgi:hypothetical protein
VALQILRDNYRILLGDFNKCQGGEPWVGNVKNAVTIYINKKSFAPSVALSMGSSFLRSRPNL